MRKAALIFAAMAMVLPFSVSAKKEVAQVLRQSRVKGGLVVLLDPADSQLPRSICKSGPYIVHVLVHAEVERPEDGLGEVYYDRYEGAGLPYRDNIVNLIVAPEDHHIPVGEIHRVLVPGGVLLTPSDRYVKPVPEALDEWTHYLHGPDNNAVSDDIAIAPPKGLQWQSGPTWSRHHERSNALNAMVSARGRVFYVVDEGSRAEAYLPPDWQLIARDAFSGVLLWKRSAGNWTSHLNTYKFGSNSYLPRKLVAVGDRAYAPLDQNAPVAVLDAATGETLRVLEATEGAYEILCLDNVLYLLRFEDPEKQHFTSRREPGGPRKIMAVDPRKDTVLWSQTFPRVTKLTLTATRDGIYFHDGERIMALAPENGRKRWESAPVSTHKQFLAGISLAPTLVACGDFLLFSGGDRKMRALDAGTGEILWEARHLNSGHTSPEDLFVVGDAVWHANIDTTMSPRENGPYAVTDITTGDTIRELHGQNARWMHHRCHRAKATRKYYLSSQMGIEYMNMETGEMDINHWIRGACLYGIMPANGLVYAPPEPCRCFPQAKVNGLAAVTHLSAYDEEAARELSRLIKGPAYPESEESAESGTHDNHSWPTFRGDMARSGMSRASISDRLSVAWKTPVGGKLSALTAADDKVFAARIDQGQVVALDALSGRRLWTFVAGGRVDSPPTIHRGHVYFGCADGRVYCLSAADGRLAWSYLAAPLDRRMVHYDHLESVWPLHGAVLIAEDPVTGKDVVWALAGRNMFVDGGLFLTRLDAVTGERISSLGMDDTDPATQADLQQSSRIANQNLMSTASPDILSCSRGQVFMRDQRFGLDGTRAAPPIRGVVHTDDGRRILVGENPKEFFTFEPQTRRLFSPFGYLDDSWFHRNFWIYGDHNFSYWDTGTYVPTGKILTHDDEKVYGYGRVTEDFRWRHGNAFRLFATDKVPEIKSIPTIGKGRRKLDHGFAVDWQRSMSFFVRAMVKTKNRLVVAGPPQLIDTSRIDPWKPPPTERVGEQQAAWDDREGAMLQVVNPQTGETLSELTLESQPVFDGMIAAYDSVFLALKNGKVVCLKGREYQTELRR